MQPSLDEELGIAAAAQEPQEPGIAVSRVLEQIAEQRVLPIVRVSDPEDAVATARACASAGMSVVELTYTTPDVGRAVGELRGDGLTIGLGTVTSPGQVVRACEAGASFVVSFAAPDGFVSSARAVGLEAIPGALTPDEVRRCLDQGAAAVKLFPARVLQPGYVRDLRTVMPKLRPIVTGGLTAADAPAWLDAGALAIGLGGDLGSVARDGTGTVTKRVREALEATRA